MRSSAAICIALLATLTSFSTHARADLAALVPGDTATAAIAIGTRGEVYEPDGKGAWVRKQRVTTSSAIAVAGRAGSIVFAFGDGVVYRLAPNGWSAIRLHQKERAVMSSGGLGTIAAVGRQVFALDRSAAGEPAKLAQAPAPVTAIAAGPTGALVQTAAAIFRLEGTKLVAVKNPPRRIAKLVSERWVLADDGGAVGAGGAGGVGGAGGAARAGGTGAIDLRTGRKTGIPPGVEIALASPVVGAPERLVIVARAAGKLELVTLGQPQIVREPIEIAPANAAPVGVVVDKSGATVIALRDNQLLVRDSNKAWSLVRVVDDLPAAKPGPAPAVSP